MCKNFVNQLLGGKAAEQAPPAAPTVAAVDPGTKNKGAVKTNSNSNARMRNTGTMVSGAVGADERRKTGVPGLGL